MQRLQAFKFALMPSGQQQRDMRRFAGACRFVFNKALALQQQRHVQGQKKLGYAELCRLLTGWRHSAETPWLTDTPIHPLQQSLKDLERAYMNFFAGRARAPRFKRKGRHDTFRYPDPKQIRLDQGNNRIFLPKLGWLRYRNSRAWGKHPWRLDEIEKIARHYGETAAQVLEPLLTQPAEPAVLMVGSLKVKCAAELGRQLSPPFTDQLVAIGGLETWLIVSSADVAMSAREVRKIVFSGSTPAADPSSTRAPPDDKKR